MVHDTLACLGQRIGRINAISDHPIITDLSTARQPTPAFPPSTGGKQGPRGWYGAIRVGFVLRMGTGGSRGEVFGGRRGDEIARWLVDGITFGRRPRWRETWSAWLVAEVTQDSLDGGRLHHRGHDPHTAVALGAVESIDEEHPPQPVGPRKSVGLSGRRRPHR